MALRLYDDPGQPHIRETRTGRRIGALARPGLASRAEQWAAQDRRQKVISARTLHSGWDRRFWSCPNGRAGGGAATVQRQFDKDHDTEEGAPGKEQN